MKIQKAVRKFKNKLFPKEYLDIYPTGSSLGNIYGTDKKYNLTPTGTTDDLPIHSIISNLSTSSYQLAKHLAKFLSPLRKLEYKVASNIEFINNIKSEKVPTGHGFMSFDAKFLFTNILLDYTIKIILRRIYECNELYTNISKTEIKKLLLLCPRKCAFYS